MSQAAALTLRWGSVRAPLRPHNEITFEVFPVYGEEEAPAHWDGAVFKNRRRDVEGLALLLTDVR